MTYSAVGLVFSLGAFCLSFAHLDSRFHRSYRNHLNDTIESTSAKRSSLKE